LKEEHSKKEAEWATKRQNLEQSVHTLWAQVGYSKKEKGKVVEGLQTMTRQGKLLENKWKGMSPLNVLVVPETTPTSFNALNLDFTCLQSSMRKSINWEAIFKPWLTLWGASTTNLKR
jgi:hypothetical protein